jgi:hypothetical protein
MKFLKSVALAVTLIAASSANAATFDLGTAAYAAGDGTDFKTIWNGIDDANKTFSSLSAFTNVDTGNNIISNLSIEFDVGNTSSIDFRFGLDAGFGASVYLNDTKVAEKIDDLWWAGNYNNAAEIITSGVQNLSSGTYTLDVYWAEVFNSGNQSAQFTVDGGTTWQNLTTTNLAVTAVPEASTYALMLSGLGVVGFMVRRRKKAA